jgi:hypothetical protein
MDSLRVRVREALDLAVKDPIAARVGVGAEGRLGWGAPIFHLQNVDVYAVEEVWQVGIDHVLRIDEQQGATHVGCAWLRDVHDPLARDQIWVNAPGVSGVPTKIRPVGRGGGWLDTTTCWGQQLLHIESCQAWAGMPQIATLTR